MGGSSKKQTVGYKYYMALHFALCYGPVDRLRRILVGDRVSWVGNVTDNDSVSINKPKLFGGEKREGGVQGTAAIMMGGAAQTLTTFVTSRLPSPAPAFRGILGVFFDGLISANNPYVKPWAFEVERIEKGWHDGAAWYVEKAAIDIDIPNSEFFAESFGSLDEYTVTSGNGALFTAGSSPYGGSVVAASQTSATPARIRRTLSLDFDAVSLSFYFRVTASNSDDACIVAIQDGVLNRLIFNPRREAAFDALRRPTISFGGAAVAMGSAALTVGTWYLLTVDWDSALDDVEAVITDAASGAEIATYTGASSVFLSGADSVTFDIDSGGTTCATEYAELRIAGLYVPRSMNGAHIIYQCLTDPQWAMGYPTSSVGESFESAADVLHAEGFGLCLLWNQQEEIGAFVRTVLDHVGGILYTDPQTGKFELTLLRADYDPDDLDVFDETNIVSLDGFQRVAYADTKNEITVVHRDVVSNKDVPITVHNLANIQAQGAVVGETKQYPGLPTAALAARVAQRDLMAASTPLAKASMTVNREGWNLRPGSVFKLNWPKLGLSAVVMRVLAIDSGTLRDGTITADIAEDVFGLPTNSYVVQEPSGWVAPDTQPALIELQQVVEIPYRTLVSETGPADLALLDEDAAFFCAVAVAPNSTAIGLDVYSRVGAADFLQNGTGVFVPTGTLQASLSLTATSVVLDDAVDLDDVEVDSLAIIGTGRLAEWVKVEAVDEGTQTITIARGVLDTVPQLHAAGTRIYFDDASAAPDEVERATGETVDFKLATLSTGGDLEFGLAVTVTAVAAQRQFRPYPPGKVQVGGVDYPTVVTAPFTVTWAHRDRLQQTAYIVEQGEASIGPEVGTTYNAYAYDDVTGSLLESLTGIAGTSWSPALLGTYTLRVEIESERDGATSWQRQARTFTFNTAGRITENGDEDRVTENGELRSQE